MFLSEVSLTTELVIGGALVVFELTVSAALFGFARRVIANRRARRTRFSADGFSAAGA